MSVLSASSYVGDVKATNISRSLPRMMADNSCIRKLRHPMYSATSSCGTVQSRLHEPCSVYYFASISVRRKSIMYSFVSSPRTSSWRHHCPQDSTVVRSCFNSCTVALPKTNSRRQRAAPLTATATPVDRRIDHASGLSTAL